MNTFVAWINQHNHLAEQGGMTPSTNPQESNDEKFKRLLQQRQLRQTTDNPAEKLKKLLQSREANKDTKLQLKQYLQNKEKAAPQIAQSQATIKPLAPNDLTYLQSAGGNFNKLTKRDIVRQIINVRPFDLMSAGRQDPKKFQADVAKLLPAIGSDDNAMIMRKQNLMQPHRVIILDDSAVEKITNDSSVQGFVANFPNERILFVPASGYEKLPDASNPIGIMNQKGKASLAHEAGHLAQNKPTQFHQNSGGSVEDEEQKYIGLPDEIGTRLGFLKNINSKDTLKQIANQGIDERFMPVIDSMIDSLPEDEIQRFEILINLPELSKIMVFNNPVVKKNFSNANAYNFFVNNIYKKVMSNIYEKDFNIQQLMSHLFYLKNKSPRKYQEMLNSIRYAYPRVAAGKPYGGEDQERQIA